MRSHHPMVRALASRLLPPEELDRVEHLPHHDAGYGYDAFGMHPEWVALGLGLCRPLYRRWFRVTSHGAHHIPQEGGAILASNHSGGLPFDGMMIWTDVVQQTDPPRVPRIIADNFVPMLPIVSTIFARAGAVGGTRGNVRRLLEMGEILLVFPEGVPGIGKPFHRRYRLQDWRVGHAELAIRHRVPVIPVGVVGAEEQLPQLTRIDRLHPFGAPYLPIPAVPFPLPVHYHIWYGEPISLQDDYAPERSDDPEVIEEASARVRDAVQRLLDRGVRERRGVFR
ncbi:MAG: lysophospholipid acyltransferase family protein [Myxococcota bacterium]